MLTCLALAYIPHKVYLTLQRFDNLNGGDKCVIFQVLTCLALAYVLEGDHGMPAMGCIAKLREASSKGSAEDHQISFLALQVSHYMDGMKSDLSLLTALWLSMSPM